MYCKRVLAGIALWMLSMEVAAALDLTGKWSPKVWTVQPALFQSGDHVWGYGGAKDVWFRGNWSDGTLVLVATQLDVVHKKCVPRGAWVVTGASIGNITSAWYQDGQRTLKGPWTRISPNPGEKVAYPYVQELNLCGSLRTYELSFASGSDQLQGADWTILAATGALLKQDSLRIEIVGHTDSTGDAKNNQDLSERRAATVKKVLVERYGADANRITTKGLGQSQPLQENSTAEGRALNRRIEIVRAPRSRQAIKAAAHRRTVVTNAWISPRRSAVGSAIRTCTVPTLARMASSTATAKPSDESRNITTPE